MKKSIALETLEDISLTFQVSIKDLFTILKKLQNDIDIIKTALKNKNILD